MRPCWRVTRARVTLVLRVACPRHVGKLRGQAHVAEDGMHDLCAAAVRDPHWSEEATTVGEDAVCSKASGALLATPQPVRASDALLRAYCWGTGVDGRAHVCARGLADTSSWCKVAGGIGTGGHCSSSFGTSAAQLRHSAGAGRQSCDLRLPAQHITNTTKLSTTLTAPASVRFPLLGLST